MVKIWDIKLFKHIDGSYKVTIKGSDLIRNVDVVGRGKRPYLAYKNATNKMVVSPGFFEDDGGIRKGDGNCS